METLMIYYAIGLLVYFGILFMVVKDATQSKKVIEELRMMNKNLTMLLEQKKMN